VKKNSGLPPDKVDLFICVIFSIILMPSKKKKFKKADWSSQALRILKERYLRKNSKGEIIETPEEMVWRVADEMAEVERQYGASEIKIKEWKEKFYSMMAEKYFMPNSPTLMNAGRGSDLQYSGCYVLPVGDSIEGIFSAVKNAAVVHQSGGGTGFAFSRLRPRGSRVKKSGGVASGPISFMRVFDSATEQVKQGGRRRGANMGVLRVDHPDVEEFIRCKLDGGITNFNISVGITEEFMDALDNKDDYYFRANEGWPKRDNGRWKEGEKMAAKSAEEVFNRIIEASWASGDPGVVWLDRINKGTANPVPEMGPVEATNPCGEQPLYPNESCNLGSINLGKMVKRRGRGYKIDWDKLENIVRLSVRFLDNVIDVNPFPLPEIEESVKANRRIGLGVMGWADLLFQMRIAYDSDEGVKLGRKIMKFISDTGWDESEKLAEEKEAFPNFKKSIYKDGKPKRNATITTIAPTGSISIIAGCSSGIEPIFALAFTHTVGERKLQFVNPFFERAMSKYKNGRQVVKEVKKEGHLGQVDSATSRMRSIFKTAHEINWKWHVKMQAAFQKYLDNAVSKTINLPNEASKEDVKEAILLAYKEGCSGITVFRNGCKGEQVLTSGVDEEKSVSEDEKFSVKPRPTAVKGYTYRVETPVGTAFVTVNHNGKTDHPLEMFINVGKAGSDVAADAEAMGRLISLCLRISSPGLSAKEVTGLIIDQLEGIGGGESIGFGKKRVRSLADGIAKVLRKHISENGKGGKVEVISEQQSLEVNGSKRKDICPDCGNATLVLEEGCAKCISCGYSKC
jgi:ribonucleoside-diphosphate reductase alpha chain